MVYKLSKLAVHLLFQGGTQLPSWPLQWPQSSKQVGLTSLVMQHTLYEGAHITFKLQ